MEKNSAGLGACSWEQGSCQFLPPCCHCKGKKGNAFKGISHDAISFLEVWEAEALLISVLLASDADCP